MNPSSIQIDRNISKLRVHSIEFTDISNQELITLLEETIQNIRTISYYWVSISSEKKGITHKPKEGEEWISGPFASIIAIQYFIEFLKDPSNFDTSKYNKVEHSYNVFPNKLIERLTLPFISAQVTFPKNVNIKQIQEYRGFSNRFDKFTPKISLVLGAGNVSSIPFLDTLYQMIAHRSVVLLKLNPVNDYLQPVFEQIFENFISRGFLVITKGDIEASNYMSNHSGVSQIHLTGSNFTYEQIVYGRKLTEKERTLKALPKLNKKSITSELGNITPFIIHPGNWTKSEIKYQARKIVTAKLNNSGFNCIAAQVIVLPKDWRHTEQLKEFIKYYMKKVGDTTSYYPGANENLKYLKSKKNYEQLNNDSCSTPFLISELDLDPTYAIKEVWSTALYFKELAFETYEDFADKSIHYVNNELWGNLGVSVIIKNHNKKSNKEVLNKYKKDLKFGTVAINEWSAVAFLIPSMPWGGYPGNRDNDIQSGQGYVHNSYFFENVEKGIVETKFRISKLIDPPWFCTNKKAHRIFKHLTYFQANNSKINLLKLIFSAVV